MDMKDASAMTEASGLVNDHDGTELAADARRAGTEACARPLAMSSQDEVMRWADRLREVTMKATLRSPVVAFLVGLWVAHRR
ncbi:hypothetical protein [Bradyrhizobium diazoefficiens]|uniref:hypothetical protein n=1 Tax=Bradyrhizobium diazoefficiens TaxID=1355477 RepID=UPI00272B1672|nr:hypothetical protein [Bradyrhizobium diazoefficiens]WLA68570.1 hypothetical protein QNN01_19060 [Bradyrhizobium diazoefficiens]